MNWRLEKMMIRFLLLCCLYPGLVQAGDEKIPFYNVEIVIFKNNTGPKDQELMLPISQPVKAKKILDLSSISSIRAARKKSYRVLRPNQLQLNKAVEKIIKSSDHDVLLHVGWHQPGLSLQKTMPIWIRSGEILGQTVDGKPMYELEGKITIALARYLHTYADLILHRRTLSDDDDLTDIHQINSYNLQEHRRMRSQKLHYLDHPQFGLLVLITPA